MLCATGEATVGDEAVDELLLILFLSRSVKLDLAGVLVPAGAGMTEAAALLPSIVAVRGELERGLTSLLTFTADGCSCVTVSAALTFRDAE